MKDNINKLTVKYNSKIVGYLAEVDGKIGFQYEADWLKTGFNISPFSLPLTDKIFYNPKDTFDGLFGVFADSLPDGWGELLMKRKLANLGINYERLSPLTKLSLVSGQGLGALTYEPCQTPSSKIQGYDFDKIAEEIAKILNDEDIELDDIFNMGGSSGGARPKAHIKIDNEDWIVKFPCHYDPKNIGELEYRANILAKKCNLNVNECKLFNSKICSGYFGAKRFDRNGQNKVHMISLSSLLETTHRIPNLDYLHLLQVTQRICSTGQDMYEAYGRMCFNVFFGNKDDHGKNFSFLYDEELGGYKLSPFYDITPCPNKFEHEMTANGNGNPTEKDLLEVAKFMKMSKTKCEKIIEHVKAVLK